MTGVKVWLHCSNKVSYLSFIILHHAVIEEFPEEEREPVYVKEGQGAVLLCVPPKVWPRMYIFESSSVSK